MAYSVRDLLGHFVKPRSMRGKMCPHACCRNKRVHPDNMPVILPSKLLRRASDAEGINPRTLITGREADFGLYASDELADYYATHRWPTPASFRGTDTRVHPKATEPRRRRRGVATTGQARWVRR